MEIVKEVEWNNDGCSFRIAQLTDRMFIFKAFGFISENYTKFYDEEGNETFDWKYVKVIGNMYDDPILLKYSKMDVKASDDKESNKTDGKASSNKKKRSKI